MNKKYRTIKILDRTYRLAKVVAAAVGEPLLALLDRLVSDEARRLRLSPPKKDEEKQS